MALVFMAACSSDGDGQHAYRITDPDAGVDAAESCTVDAGAADCCRFLPDTNAVVACVALPAGSCGVIACRLPDCSYERINACGAN